MTLKQFSQFSSKFTFRNSYPYKLSPILRSNESFSLFQGSTSIGTLSQTHANIFSPVNYLCSNYHTTNFLSRTILQAIRNSRNRRQDLRTVRKRAKIMAGKPQRKATVVQLFERAPKKPNSARRRCCRVKLNETGQLVQAFIPGEGHRLQKHAIVLVRGGPVKDLIGLKLKVIRGALDCAGVEGRQTRRSIYGSKKTG